MALMHLRREHPRNYILALLATVGAVLGLNLLFDLTGITDSSTTYQAVAESQLSASLAVGLLCYGVVTALAEELMFRGILYNELKRELFNNRPFQLPFTTIQHLHTHNCNPRAHKRGRPTINKRFRQACIPQHTPG